MLIRNTESFGEPPPQPAPFTTTEVEDPNGAERTVPMIPGQRSAPSSELSPRAAATSGLRLLAPTRSAATEPSVHRRVRLLRGFLLLELTVFIIAALASLVFGLPEMAIVAAGWLIVQGLGTEADARVWRLPAIRSTLVRGYVCLVPVALAALLLNASAGELYGSLVAVVLASSLGRAVPWWLQVLPGRARVVVVARADQLSDLDLGNAEVLGFLDVESQHPHADAGAAEPDLTRLGGLDALTEVLSAENPDELLVIPGSLDAERVRSLSWDMECFSTDLVLSVPTIGVAARRLAPISRGSTSAVVVRDSGRSRLMQRVRTTGDTVLAGLGIVLISPLVLLLVALIRLDTPGPAFFLQTRVGQHGRTFRMLKFRTMHVDAEAMLERLRRNNEGNEVLFKIRKDPRITRMGTLLRRTSLDELPQLFNVLTGRMALVGPRPALPREVEMYDDLARRRLCAKPGITGLWQVSGRSNLSWDRSIALDVDYVDNWSNARDLGIMLRTVKAVVSRDGAY